MCTSKIARSRTFSKPAVTDGSQLLLAERLLARRLLGLEPLDIPE
jgi:hypothetical protein